MHSFGSGTKKQCKACNSISQTQTQTQALILDDRFFGFMSVDVVFNQNFGFFVSSIFILFWTYTSYRKDPVMLLLSSISH
jgi:hypothetical protein